MTDARSKTVSYTYDLDGRKTAEYDTTGGASETSSDELASWLYDTLAKGQLTSSTSYYNGSAYTEQVSGYYNNGLPSGAQTIIPPAQGALQGTYTTGDSYDPDTNQLTSLYQSAAGGLPAETPGWGYDTAGDPVSFASSLWGYATTVSYSEYGQPLQYEQGPSSNPVYVTDAYDEQTQRLTGQQVAIGSTTAVAGGYSYAYDNVGDVLSDTDTPSAGAAQDQCFQYDYLGRLSQAWSQGSASCTSGPSQSAESVAAAPYWEKYSYNAENDMTSDVSTPASGAGTTTTSAYPPAGSAQPHAVSSQTAVGPGGTATTNYGYNAGGDLTTTTGAQSQSLSWDDAGRLSQLSGAAGTTGYIYDADGNLLIRQDPGSTTLYMPGEEITLTGSTLSGTRYYSIGGVTIAARTSAGQIDYLSGDQQGTSTLAVNATTTAVTSRFYDPYGNPAGAPATGWPGQQGFQNGAADTATSLTDIGAREYQPATCSFISPDPLLSATDPQDLNPYAYAQDAPPTGEDPTGQYTSYGSSGDSYVGTSQSYQNTHGDPPPAAGRAQSGTSDNFTLVTPHVIIQKTSPYYSSMVNALDDLLETNPGYGKLLTTGDINTQDWVWSLACHAAGTSACNPLFMAQVAPGGDTAPPDGTLLVGAAFGPAGFGIAVPASSAAAAADTGQDGGVYGPYHRRPGPQTTEEMDAARNGTATELRGGVNRGSSFRSVDAHYGPLPEGRQGYQFTTSVKPSDSGASGIVRWVEGTPGVTEISGDLVAIPIEVDLVVLAE